MSGTIYDEVEIEDFDFDPETRVFYYPCPCGDRFQITEAELVDGEEIATCPSCSLMIRVVYEDSSLQKILQRDQQNALVSPVSA